MILETPQGVIILIKVITGASSTRIDGERNGELLVRVTSQPEKGNANIAIIKLISSILKIPKNRLTILSGSTSRHKKILVTDTNIDYIKKACINQRF